MDTLDTLIQQEKKINPWINDLLNVFLLDVEWEWLKTFEKEREEFIAHIDINEKEIEKITINGDDNRKTIYRHLMTTGVLSAFMGTKKPQEIEMIYTQLLKFKQAFKTLNKKQATLFTKKIIELFNESRNLEKTIEQGIREHKYGLIFQVMIKEIEKIK